MWFFGILALAALAQAGDAQDKIAVVEVETVHIIEYTEVCVCPTKTILPTPAITTLSCCDTCAPVTVTASAQLITSCTTGYTKTTTVCESAGVYVLGEKFYPCNSPPCLIEYQAPCPTCYVCPYSDCWVPSNLKTKHVTICEYFDGYDNEIACWDEQWTPWTYIQTWVKTKWFPQPTIFIENNIEINITAPTTLTYTQTSTMTATETATITQTTTVTASTPVSVTPSPNSSASSSPSAATTTELKFILMSGSRAGYPVVILDGKLAYGNLSSNTQTLRLTHSQLYDLNGHLTYISRSNLTSQDRSYLYFVSPSLVLADELTDVFSVDEQKNLVVTVDGITLMAVICGSDRFIRFGYSVGSCEAVVLVPETSAPTITSTLPSSIPSIPSSPSSPSSPASEPMSTPSYPSSTPASEAPSSAPLEPPSSVPPQFTSTTISEPPSSVPSEAPSLAPRSSPPVNPATFARLLATPAPNRISQGHGSPGDVNGFSVLQLTAYDQFNQTLRNANFTLRCDNQNSTLCEFRLSPGRVPVTGVTTNENGTLEVYFSSLKSGFKCVRIFDYQDVQAKAFPINVDQVANCPGCSANVYNNSNALTSLIMGVDNPILRAYVIDLYGDPVSGVNVTFEPTVAPTRKRTRLTFTGITDNSGIATWTANNLPQGGPYAWTATPSNCSAINLGEMSWYYGVNCSATTAVSSSGAFAWTDEVVLVSGNYYPFPGASLDGARISLSLDTPTTTQAIVPLNSDGHWYQNVTFNGTSMAWPIRLSFIGASQPCSFNGTIMWRYKQPVCNIGVPLSLSISSATTASPITVTIQSFDSLGIVIPRVPWSIYSQTRGLAAWSASGVTNDGGVSSIVYSNGGFGVGADTLIATIGDGLLYNCTATATITWT